MQATGERREDLVVARPVAPGDRMERDRHTVEAVGDPGPVDAGGGGRERDARSLGGRGRAAVDRDDGDRAQRVRGSRGQVLHVDGVDEIGLRLMEMGLVPGTEFTLLGAAPLGDPLELEVRGYRLSLRKSEAARVEVATQA